MNHLTPPEFKGYFWLPGHEDTKAPGRCYNTESGTIELELLSECKPEEINFFKQSSEIPRILGLSHNGKYITLENCLYKNYSYNVVGLAVENIYVSLLLVGCHFEKDEPIRFDEIHYYSDAINDWLNFAPIKTSISLSPPRGATISFSEPEALEWTLSSGVTMGLRASVLAKLMPQPREAKITQKTIVGFKFSKMKSLDDLLDIVSRFNNFVAFVVDQAIPPNKITAYSKELFNEINNVKHPVPIQIFYTPDIKSSPNLSQIAGPFPLFTFQYVRDRFGEIMSNWLNNYDSSFNLYFATKGGRDLYLDNRFLMLTQALEALHRHSSNETPFSPEEYSKLCSILEKEVPSAFKEWLKPKLKYGNELSLRNRLKLLFVGFESIYENKARVNSLIAQIIDTRNYLTHYDESLKSKKANGTELYKLCLVLETLFQLHMAKLCGLPIDEVIRLSKQSELFKRKLEFLRFD